MIFRDLIERYHIQNSSLIKYFTKRVLLNVTKPTSIHKIFNELKSVGLKTGKDNLYEWLDLLQSIYLIMICEKQEPSFVKKIAGERKFYTVDNGFLNAISYQFSDNWGKLLENVIYMHYYRQGYLVTFYRDKHECDFVISNKDKLQKIVQVCYSLSDNETRYREINGLVEACKAYKQKKGFIITMDVEEEITIDGIKINILPAIKELLTK